MRPLIDELRSKSRNLNTGAASQSRRLKSPQSFEEVREHFYRRTGRFNGVPRELNTKQRREASIFFGFLLAYDRLPARRVAIGDRPDFRFSLGRRRIGIELVQAFVPRPADRADGPNRGNRTKEQEMIQDRIIDRAVRIHAEAGGAPARVHASFSDTNFKKSDIDRAAAQLASLVPRRVPRNISLREAPSRTNWPQGLVEVRVSPMPKIVRHLRRWDADRGGWFAAGEDVLPDLLAQKEAKLPGYLGAKCDEYWLLVYVAGTSAASFIDMADPLHPFGTRFDEVFLYSPMEAPQRSVLRLNCHSPRRYEGMAKGDTY